MANSFAQEYQIKISKKHPFQDEEQSFWDKVCKRCRDDRRWAEKWVSSQKNIAQKTQTLTRKITNLSSSARRSFKRATAATTSSHAYAVHRPALSTSSHHSVHFHRSSHHIFWKKFWQAVLILLAIFALSLAVIWFFFIAPLLGDLPSPQNITANNERYAVSTQIFDRHGTKLYEIFSGERRIPIHLSELPDYVAQSSIAIEDKNFYKHFGFDPRGIIRAFIKNKSTGEVVQGGSTITQQLVKKAFLTDEKSYKRKIKEIFLAIWVDAVYSKEEILEMYLNYIPYGGVLSGIGAAAESYFGKEASDLTLAEAAFLAGLPQAPSKYSPFSNDPTAATNRQQEVLRKMVESGYITQAEADTAAAEKLVFQIDQTDILAPHFVFYIKDQLIAKYGEDAVEKGGLRVTTTLDLDLQNMAQASVSAEVATLANKQVSNGAALITVPNTGEILAMVGSTDYFDRDNDGQVNVTTSLRQPGSSIKPLLYAIGMQQKLINPASVLIDMSTCFKMTGQSDYCPRNYSGGFSGPVTIREALGSSLNIPAVKVMYMVGVQVFINYAREMGLSSLGEAVNYGLSLALGGGETTMVQMAEAFATLDNQGIHVPSIGILKVEDYLGNVLEEYNPETVKSVVSSMNEAEESESPLDNIERILDRAPAWMTAEIMRDNSARVRGFGASSELVVRGADGRGTAKAVSVKTGTTNDMRDNWTIGFTPDYLVAVWVGNNDNSSMNRYLVSGVTGAAPIWNDIMSQILAKTEEVTWPDPPDTVQKAGVCSTGMPPRESIACSVSRTDYYWTKSWPTRSTSTTAEMWIDRATGVPPELGKEDNLVLESHTTISDPFVDNYCTDCTRAVDENGKTIYGEKTVVSETTSIKMIGD